MRSRTACFGELQSDSQVTLYKNGVRRCVYGAGLAALLPLLACRVPEPDPGDVRLARLAANTAADAIDDLGAVDDPGAAGIRDAFRAAALAALAYARTAHAKAPERTNQAYTRSLEAADASDKLGAALAVALESWAALETGALRSRAERKAAEAAARATAAELAAQEADREAVYATYIGDRELNVGLALSIAELGANLGLGDVDAQLKAAHAAAAEARRSAFAELNAERSADHAALLSAIAKLEGLMEAADSARRAGTSRWFDLVAENQARRVALLAAQEAMHAEVEVMKSEHEILEAVLLEYVSLVATSMRDPGADPEVFLASARDTLSKSREATLTSRQVVVSARKIAHATTLAVVDAVGGSSSAIARAVRLGDAGETGPAIHAVRAEAVRNAIGEAVRAELTSQSALLSSVAREVAEDAAKAALDEAEQAELEALHATRVAAADVEAAERLRVEAITAYRVAAAAWLSLEDD